jgi:hypothetical protein
MPLQLLQLLLFMRNHRMIKKNHVPRVRKSVGKVSNSRSYVHHYASLKTPVQHLTSQGNMSSS